MRYIKGDNLGEVKVTKKLQGIFETCSIRQSLVYGKKVDKFINQLNLCFLMLIKEKRK